MDTKASFPFLSFRSPPGLLRSNDSLIYPSGVWSVGNNLFPLWRMFVPKIKKGRIAHINKIANVVGRVCYKGELSKIISELLSIFVFYISAFYHLSRRSWPREVSCSHEEEVIRQVQVFNSYSPNTVSSSRQNNVQNMTFDMRWFSDKLNKTQLAVQLNKTSCVRVVGLIHPKTKVIDKKYILKWNVVTRKKMGKLIKEVTCGKSCHLVFAAEFTGNQWGSFNSVSSVGDVAQLVEHRTGTPPTQVRLPGAARDLSPKDNFQCRLSYGVRILPVRNRTLKIP